MLLLELNERNYGDETLTDDTLADVTLPDSLHVSELQEDNGITNMKFVILNHFT